MPDAWLTVLSYLFAGGVAAAVVTFVLERKSKKARGAVDTRTVDLQVDAVGLGNLAQRLALIERAQDAERESWVETFASLRKGLDDALARIAYLERQVQQTTNRYREAVAYIRMLRVWINEHIPGDNAPPVPAGIELEE